MRLQIGSVIRPNNEAVVTPSYSPIYDFTRLVSAMKIRWEISGRIVNFPTATPRQTTTELKALETALLQKEPYLAMLEDTANVETFFVLNPVNCSQGPNLIDFSIPTSEQEVYATGGAYKAVFEAIQKIGPGSDLLEFSEEVSLGSGGVTYVYVGGAVNFAERQTATERKSWKYTQSGSAVGLLNYPAIPPPIWPFAQMEYPRVVLQNPRVRGARDTEYPISWEYTFEWHTQLIGVPHRSNIPRVA